MVQWFENLKAFIHLDFSNAKKIKLISDISISKLVSYEDNRRTINLNVTPATLSDPKQKQQLLEIVNSAGLENVTQPLLEEHASEEAEQLVQLYSGDPMLDYFKGKIPDDDMPILRAAVFIKKVYADGGSVDRYKTELRERYGKRGDIIANLCSAGYFETHIKPMYQELEQRPNFSREMFVENYNIILDGTPFAVFVRRSHSYQDLFDEVDSKVITNQRYGRKSLNVHAIGAENVKMLNDLLQDQKITRHFSAEPSIKSEGNIMVAQIFFRAYIPRILKIPHHSGSGVQYTMAWESTNVYLGRQSFGLFSRHKIVAPSHAVVSINNKVCTQNPDSRLCSTFVPVGAKACRGVDVTQ